MVVAAAAVAVVSKPTYLFYWGAFGFTGGAPFFISPTEA